MKEKILNEKKREKERNQTNKKWKRRDEEIDEEKEAKLESNEWLENLNSRKNYCSPWKILLISLFSHLVWLDYQLLKKIEIDQMLLEYVGIKRWFRSTENELLKP